jgi:hypothetical protein
VLLVTVVTTSIVATVIYIQPVHFGANFLNQTPLVDTTGYRVEAEELIGKAYARHKALADNNESFPPSLKLTKEDLEKLEEVVHYKPVTVSDKVAAGSVVVLEKLMELFFREKYDHHAVILETVACGGSGYCGKCI